MLHSLLHLSASPDAPVFIPELLASRCCYHFMYIKNNLFLRLPYILLWMMMLVVTTGSYRYGNERVVGSGQKSICAWCVEQRAILCLATNTVILLYYIHFSWRRTYTVNFQWYVRKIYHKYNDVEIEYIYISYRYC